MAEPENTCQRNPQFTPYEKSQYNTNVQSIVDLIDNDPNTIRNYSSLEDLIDNDPNTIRNYSSVLTNLSNVKLKIVLFCLDAYNLKNILLNIPPSDLLTIYNRITWTDFNRILD